VSSERGNRYSDFRGAGTISELAADLVLAIDEALEHKSHDEGHYGKRDWAMVEVLKCLRDLAEALK